MSGDMLISAEAIAKGIADHLARMIATDVHDMMARYRDGMVLCDSGEYAELVMTLARAELGKLRERAGA